MPSPADGSEIPPKVLFFAPILEFPPAGGPQLSVVNAVKVLHEIAELHIVTTVPLRNNDATTAFFREHSAAVFEAPSSRLAVTADALNRQVRRLRRVASTLVSRVDADFVVRYADRFEIKVFWIDRVLEHAFGIYHELRRRRPSALIVGDTCSVYSRFVLRELPLVSNPARRWWIRARGWKKVREERELTASADVVTAVSELDADYFRSIAPDPTRVKLFSNVVDVRDYLAGDPHTAAAQRPTMLLLGSFGKQTSPMDRAAKWLAEDVMPMVLRQVPDAHVTIIGRNADQTQSALASNAISVIGQVPSVLPYLQTAIATLVPLRFESGTRFKILESGAASVPCISTTLGAEGIPVTSGKNILIADTAEEFAAAMVRLFTDREYGRQLGRSLHELVVAKYSLDTQIREGRIIIRHLLENAP